MASFFGKLKGSAISSSAGGLSPSKKDHSGQNLSPLERLLEGTGPLRDDGGDKYFGMENFGNTCYCNSIIQCLYHSLPFRQHVVQHTVPSAAPTLPSPPNGIPKLQLRTQTGPNGSLSPLSPTAKAHSPATATSPARRSAGVPIGAGQGGIRPEDRPDTSEFKKKQAMLAGPILTLDYDHSDSYGMSESLFTCLKGIFEAMAAHPSRLGVVSPQRFLETLKRENEMYRGLIHQDAHEFFNLLLNEVITGVEVHSKEQKSADQGPAKALSMAASSITGAMLKQMAHDNTDTRPRSRWVHDLFEGTLTSETKCLTCENTSSRDEAFLDLSVDLEHHSSVTSCLRKFSQEEMLCERNKFHCDNCGGLQEAEKRMKIKRLPRILALHLKRFKYEDQDHQQLQKLFHRVVYPFHLRLFNTTDEAEDPDRLYELYAVVVHIGAGPLQGHYVSVIKTPDRGWLLFDDELVEPVDRSYVWNFFGGRSGSACAYVLFYQETTMEVVEREQEAEFLASMAKKTATATPTASNLPKVPAAVSPIVEKENRPVMTTTTTTPPPPPLFGPSANGEPNGALLTTTSTGTNLSPTKGLVLTNTNSILPTTKTPITNGAHINVQPPTPLSSQQQQQYQQQHQQQPQPQTSPQPQPQPQHTLHHSISRASLGYHHLRKKMLSSFHSGKDSKDSKDSKESKGT